MYLVQIFSTSPLAGLALCICLGTILWCIILTHRQTNRLDKFLAGLLGLIAIYEALRILRDAGFVFGGLSKWDGWADFLIASLYLIAVMMLKVSSMDRARTKVRLRLVEANEKSVEIGKTAAALPPDLAYLLFDACPLAAFATDTDLMVIYWNPAAEDLLGWTRDEVLGQPLPFAESGPLVNKRGRNVDAAVWSVPILSAGGLRRATLVVAASSAALREAGLANVAVDTKPQLALNS
ncbi:MAG TPA: PAS domain-containing protein [Bryobacteraceae bacterium]|nr:PAS domain-containing protein [Bryobacteraceae bacterium]